MPRVPRPPRLPVASPGALPAARTGLPLGGEVPALLSHVRQGRCLLFVGAGLSRPAGFPDWKGLMQTLVRRTVEHLALQREQQALRRRGLGHHLGAAAADPASELQALVERGRFTECADHCRTLVGRAVFAGFLRDELQRPAEPPATHRAIVATPYAGIVTTNFDTLLEDAYARHGAAVPRAPTGAELAQHGTLLLDQTFFILKAHGSIDDEASLVFTSEDYRRITHENPAFQAMMSALLLSNAVLFVGYSLGDPNFRLLLDSQLSTFGGHMPPRFALMEDVGPVERQILRRTAGIEVISFARGDYAQVQALLVHLALECAPNPPRQPLPTAALSADQVGALLAPLGPRRERLRERRPVKVIRLSLRTQGPQLLLQWLQTDTRDPQGLEVPLQHQFVAVGHTPDWLALSASMPDALAVGPAAWPALMQVAQVLTVPLRPFLQWLDAPEVHAARQTLVLDLAPELAAVPWEWCLFGGQPLATAMPVVRAITEPREAARGRPLVGRPLRALLVGDTVADPHLEPSGQPREAMSLPGARREVQDIARLLTDAGHEARVLLGADATFCRLRDLLAEGDWDVVHFAGHGWFEDNATVLHLHDGRVSASEWVTLLTRHPPALWLASSHYTGCVPAFTEAHPVDPRATHAFDDFYRSLRASRPGLERAAARAGVAAFIGCMGQPEDLAATSVAVALYAALLAGEPVGRALWQARRAAPAGESTALQFSVAGLADLRLV